MVLTEFVAGLQFLKYRLAGPCDYQVGILGQQNFSDGDDLLDLFPLTEDDFRKTLTQAPMVIYLRELQILVGKIVKEMQHLLFTNLPLLELPERSC
jgi:hypothetical protein